MNNLIILKRKIIIFSFIGVFLVTSAALAENPVIKIGVLAKRGPERCIEKWSLTAEYLSNKLPGKKFVIVPIDYKQIHTVVEKGKIDFFLVNPSFYVEFEIRYKINRIATVKNMVLGKISTTFGGVIFCKKQREDIRRLSDLKRKTFMAVEEASFGGWRTAWRELKEAGINPFKDFASLSFGGTHDAVIYAVRDGKVDAGTVRTDTLERMHKEGKISLDDFYVIHEHGGGNEHLASLHSTRGYPEWPIAKLKHISNELAENITIALIGMPRDSAAAKAARCGGWTIPLNYQSVHDCLKELKIGPYKDFGKITLTDVLKKYWFLILINFVILIALAWFLTTHIKLNQKINKAHKKLSLEFLERLQAEKALLESEEKHRLFFENAPIGIIHYNKKGITTAVNDAMISIFGSSHEKLIGLDINDIPDKKFSKEVFKSLNGERGYFESEYESYTGGKKAKIKANWIPIIFEGKVVSGVGIVEDVTQQNLAEKMLKESHDRQRHLYSMTRLMCDNLPDLIWAKDLENRFVFVNKICCEKLLNVKDTEEPIGKTDIYFAAREKKFHPENPEYHTFGEVCTNSDMVVLETKKPQVFEETGNLKGNFICLDVYKAPFWDEKGNLIGTVGCARDITKEKEMEKEKLKLESQLQQAQKMESIGTLAGGIAHDFNNILFPMFGYLEMMMEGVPEDNPLFDDLAEVFNGAKRARDLVQQILTFSRQTENEIKPLKVQLIIKEVLRLIRSSLPATINIRQDINNDCGLIIADPAQIHQVAMNLITNAYHAMEKTGGTLTIKLKEIKLEVGDLQDLSMVPGLHVCLTVADTGFGMGQDIVSKIFDPYFTTKEKGKGTGLGLAISHGIIKGHGGHISVYSEPGKGTEFKVYLPVIKPQETVQSIESDSPIQKGTERVLLVDDQDTVIQIEKKMLERLGYHVTFRTSSPDALEAFRASPDKFDIVITDMTMPNMTGDKLAVELTKIRPDIPILLCTGFSETMSEEKAAYMGIKGFLLKPIVIKDLSHKIRELLKNNESFA